MTRARGGARRRVDVRELGAIFAGGMAGALARVWVSRQFTSTAPHWPWATFLINIAGSIALAYAVTRLQERLPQSTYRRPFLGTGFCGAFTTFSTMHVEIVEMLNAHRYGLAVSYSAASIVAGYLAIWLTSALVRRSRRLV